MLSDAFSTLRAVVNWRYVMSLLDMTKQVKPTRTRVHLDYV